jgi:N6-L-threonylcarbamoyladenine synthase
MRILSIETSCDETSIAIINTKHTEVGFDSVHVYAHYTATQIAVHKEYGGVFPAIAKREHIKALVPVLDICIKESVKNNYTDFIKIDITHKKIEKIHTILQREPELAQEFIDYIKNNELPQVDAIAVTSGPGLEIALWTGICFAKALSVILNIPVVGINHMLGHLYSPLISLENKDKKDAVIINTINNNALALLVSGGHTEIIKIENNNFTKIGQTVDDAIGEAFDKVARLVGLSYPGGPEISRLAQMGRDMNIVDINFPRPMIYSGDYNFSYSGLKTAVMYYLRDNPIQNENDKIQIAMSFENAAVEVIIKKVTKAIREFMPTQILLGGGVAANTYLKKLLQNLCDENNVELLTPSNAVAGDNALMIALSCYIQYKDKEIINEIDTIKANGNWEI